MTKAERQEQLGRLMLELLPANGGAVGNGQLLTLWAQAAAEAGLQASAEDFAGLREDLVARGLVVKGKGRGGSTARAAAAAPGSEAFELESGAAAAADGATGFPGAPQPTKKPASKPKLRAADAGDAGDKAQVLSYRHPDRRKNNPEVGLVSEASDPQQPKQAWAYNPHLDPVLNFDSARAELENLVDEALASGDEAAMRAALAEIKRRGAPYLQWAGKAERTSFEVDTVSLHVHERIDPMSILSAVRKQMDEARARKAGRGDEAAMLGRQASLFEAPFESLPLRDAVDFYHHDKGWSNRLVAGDSLLLMNSLLVKEGMAGQVQMIYIDPPYGIKYGSNFQPFVNKRDVKDRADADLTQEPEMIKAFRDTWELGIHSYLTYLRDRLLLARDLLSETGSVFVQISDENLHLVRGVLDEALGADNFIALIAFKTGSGFVARFLKSTSDYLVWYAKSKDRAKFNRLYANKEFGEDSYFDKWQLADKRVVDRGFDRPAPAGAELVAIRPLVSGFSQNTNFNYEWHGKSFYCGSNRSWKSTGVGLNRIGRVGRIDVGENTLKFVARHSDLPLQEITHVWDDTMELLAKKFAVQTATKAIERCILMTTDPGDLVLDPTCGSGTTAFVAEKWGRRWLTCDTSRVAVTLAKTRLMTASYDYFELRYPHEGLKGGFIYKTVPHVTLKSIANNPEIDSIYERLHPSIESALSALSAALRKHAPTERFTVTEGVRIGETLRLGSKGADLYEWEVPYPTDDGALPEGWPAALREPLTAFHTARQRMQAEMDRSIAAHADNETLYDQPEKARNKLRITGPFSVEAVPFPTVLSLDEADAPSGAEFTADAAVARSGATSRHAQWRDELLKTGIRGRGGQMLKFSALDTLAGTVCLHCSGTLSTGDNGGEPAVVSFGPEHGALEQRQVEHAIGEAGELFPRPKFIVFCAFAFDPEAAKDIDAFKGITALKAQMNTDLLTEDLKKARASNQSFWLMGQPDVLLKPLKDGRFQVEVNGFDYFDTARGELVSGGKAKIAMWSLDTDYYGRSLFPHQVFFPMAGKGEGWEKLKKDIRAELDDSKLKAFQGTVSLPFEPGQNRRVAVKIVDDRGIESLKVLALAPAED